MNKQLYFTALLVLAVMLSVSVVCASDVSVTDSYAASLVDDTLDVSVYDGNAGSSEISVSSVSNVGNDSSKVSLSSEEVLESDNSNTLSTNTINESKQNYVFGATNNEKHDTKVTWKSSTTFDNSGQTFKILLTDGDGTPLSGERIIKLTINSKTYSAATDSKGYAIFNLNLNLDPGSYNVTFTYKGNTWYEASSGSKVIKFNKYPTYTVNSSTSFGEGYGNSFKVAVTLDNAPLANKDITFKVDGKSYSVKTDADGIAALPVGNLAAGVYTVTYTNKADSKVSAKTGSTNITVKKRHVTKLTWKSSTTFDNSGQTFKVLLTDDEGAVLSGKTVKLTVNSKTYSATTDSKGYATFTLKLNLDPGSYNVTFAYNGNNWYEACSGSQVIKYNKYPTFKVNSSTSFGEGYGNSFKVAVTLDNAPLANKDITFKVDGKTYTTKTDADGIAALPVGDLSAGTYTVTYTNKADSKVSAKTGSTNITIKKRYVTKLTWKSSTTFDNSGQTFKVLLTDGDGAVLSGKTVKLTVNSKTYSATTDSKGYATFTLKLNLDPGSYNVTFAYNGNNWYEACSGSQVIKYNKYPTFKVNSSTSFGEGYGNSFKISVKLDNAPLANKDITFKVDGKTYTTKTDADGIAALPVGDLSVGTYTVTYTNKADSKVSAKTGSTNITIKKRYVTKVTWKSSTTFDDSGQTFKVLLTDGDGAALSGKTVKLTANSKTYSATTDSNGYATFNLKLAMKEYTVTFTYSGNNWYEASSGSQKITVTSSGPSSVSINDILTGAETLKTYYEKNNKYPTTVTVAGYGFTMPEFLYLMSQAIYQLGNSDTSAVKCIYGVKTPSSIRGDEINAQLKKADYLTVAKRVADFIKEKNRAPNYSSSAVGKLSFNVLLDSSSRILVFYKNNDKYLPNYVTIKCSKEVPPVDPPVSVTINQILTGANTLKTYYEKNHRLPATVDVADYPFTIPEFLYLMSQATYQLGNSDTSAITCIYGVKAPSAASKVDDINGELMKSGYLKVANDLSKYIKNNNKAPSTVSSDVGNINYTQVVDALSRVLAFYKNNDKTLPSYVTIVQGEADVPFPINRVNVINTITDLTPYYQETKNCQVNNSQIKTLVDSLTKGMTSDIDKAYAIYNYVRDEISYSFYYDTKKGAVGTLNAKTGNCVDQAHLVIAMFRTAGLAARYEHGTCYFPLDGATYGHVWAQVLLGNVWVVADPSSQRNSLGNVVSWNTNSYTHNGYYASLPF